MKIQRIPPFGALVLGAALAGCEGNKVKQDTDEAAKRAEELTTRAGEKLNQAGRELRHEAGQAGEKLDQAGRELRTEAGKLGHDVDRGAKDAAGHPEGGKTKGAVAKRDGAGNVEVEEVVTYERFESIDDETKEAFASRANTALSKLEKDIASLERKAVTNEDAYEDLADAKQALKEARTDLSEVQAGDASFFDDGKLGVTLAINKAQRELKNVREELGKK